MDISLKRSLVPTAKNIGLRWNTLFALIITFVCFASSCSSNQSKEAENTKDQTGHSNDSPAAVGSEEANTNAVKYAAGDSLIVPGVSIGRIKLDTDADETYKRLGKPDAGDGAMGKAVSTWYEKHDLGSNALSIYTARDVGNSPIAMIKQIRVTSPAFKTQQGLGPSSTLPEIQAVFNLEKNNGYKMAQKSIDVYSDRSGISFEIDENKKCIGIVVSAKGNFQRDTYARFLPGITVNE